MMKTRRYAPIIALIICFAAVSIAPAYSQKTKRDHRILVDTLITNSRGEGNLIEISFIPGAEHNHPLFAFWIEDTEGNYIQTLYVSESIATGVFKFGDKSSGRWQPGEIERPASLPYWAHKRNIPNQKGTYMPTAAQPVADAYSGATHKAAFVLLAYSDKVLNGKFRLLAEINQSWDWNTHWTNNKFPDDKDYFSSAQPAVVYEVLIDADKPGTYELKAIGRSHHSGRSGELFTDLNTLTTALEIAKTIVVKLK
ncbi:MAG: hypothetical protein RBS33_02065 [Lentimicrobium sp.]|jgi:hypothetical protein|nr:hypothetical protein [Lentimicrobiaceae bacterium]MDY0024749.1 hypothetical protein [Lentimicrobium sp.]